MDVWLGNEGLSVEYGGQTLSSYDVSFVPETNKLGEVTPARLFATGYRSPQPKLFDLAGALGEDGWSKVLRMEEYDLRSRSAHEALQQVLFAYVDAL